MIKSDDLPSNMLTLRRSPLLLIIFCFWHNYTKAETNQDLQICQSRLSKYRNFLLAAILRYENICNAYNLLTPTTLPTLANRPPSDVELFGEYQSREQQRNESPLLQLLMAQFDDFDFINIIRNAVIERCRRSREEQRDEKRNLVILGKKQRFHSWGGKRSDVAEEYALNQNTNSIPFNYLII
uniref:Leucokinin n=1 Tax=Glossina pallidipes TaxID=7398 RepID=A0A1B0AFY1_GLOPL